MGCSSCGAKYRGRVTKKDLETPQPVQAPARMPRPRLQKWRNPNAITPPPAVPDGTDEEK